MSSYHDLHVWAVTTGKISLTVHVVHSADVAPAAVMAQITSALARQFGITHVTIQCELTPCAQADEEFHFPLAESAHAEPEAHGEAGSHAGHHH